MHAASVSHLLEDVRVGDDHAQVDIDGRDQSALQLELPKLDGLCDEFRNRAGAAPG